MSQSVRLGTSLLARVVRTSSIIPRRTFAASAITRQPDMIQDLYLRELRAYKIPPQKPEDAEGHVQKFTPPPPPKSPEETNLASSIKEYEDQVVEIEGQASSGESTEKDHDYFEDLEEPEESTSHGH